MPKVSVMTLPNHAMPMPRAPMNSQGRLAPGTIIWLTIRNFLSSLLCREQMGIYLLSFLLARVSIMGEISPFGIAFFTAITQVCSRQTWPVAFWALAGVLSAGRISEAVVYLAAMLIYARFADRFTLSRRRQLAVPLLMFAGMCLGGILSALALWREATLYSAVLTLLDAAMCMLLSYLFLFGAPLLVREPDHPSDKESRYSAEALLCAVLILATGVAGIGNFDLWGYSVRNIIGSLLIMALSLSGGAGLGAPVGVMIGLAAGLMDANVPQAVSLYALAGSMAGVFRSLGKFGVAAGYILGSMITVLYFGQARELSVILTETAVSAALFAAMPASFLAPMTAAMQSSAVKTDHGETALRTASGKLNNIADMFVDLADAFGQISADAREKMRDEELARMLSAVGEKICGSCPKRPACWEGGFFRTYQSMLDALAQAEAGKLKAGSAPGTLAGQCVRLREIVDTVNAVAERNSMYSFWQKKIAESRQMVTEQMRATGIILGNLSMEINKGPAGEAKLATMIRDKAARLGCRLEEVSIRGANGRTCVEITKAPCQESRECFNTLLPLVSQIMQERLSLRTECGAGIGKRRCRIVMEAANRYQVQTATASAPKSPGSVSGDSCAVVQLGAGKTALMLSDGMGSGSKAADESALALRFLQKLLSVGFDVDVAVKTVNSLLLLRTPDETFATMDMLILDNFSGEAEFLKIGSAPSFIKRVREVTAVRSNSLPIGILNQIEIEPIKMKLAAGDIVVLVSDGIADAPRSGIAKEDWLVNFLRRCEDADPQTMADAVMRQAMLLGGKELRDDMTVVVAKLTERPTVE